MVWLHIAKCARHCPSGFPFSRRARPGPVPLLLTHENRYYCSFVVCLLSRQDRPRHSAFRKLSDLYCANFLQALRWRKVRFEFMQMCLTEHLRVAKKIAALSVSPAPQCTVMPTCPGDESSLRSSLPDHTRLCTCSKRGGRQLATSIWKIADLSSQARPFRAQTSVAVRHPHRRIR